MEKVKRLLATMLVLLIAFASIAPVLAASQPDNSGRIITWDDPSMYNPVTLKIIELRAKGMSDAAILKELEKLGIGWYPETGAVWIGTTPTPEELKQLPPRTGLPTDSGTGPVTLEHVQKNAWIKNDIPLLSWDSGLYEAR